MKMCFLIGDLRIWIATLCIAGVVSRGEAQFSQPEPTELPRSVVQLLNAGKVDDAIASLKMQAEEPDSPSDVGQTMFMAARILFQREKYGQSLALPKRIAERST